MVMKHTALIIATFAALATVTKDALADQTLLNLGPQELVQANGVDVQVPGYSVPSFVDFNSDSLKDLIIGEGGGGYPSGKVRVYLNVGTQSEPQFFDFFYVQSSGADLVVPAEGCLGCFPRVVYWNADDRKDLLVGLADGTVKFFLNIGTDESPAFGAGTPVTAASPGIPLDVGKRATPTFVDWNSDGMKDLVVGALDGKIHIYINCGCTWPDPAFYFSEPLGQIAQENGHDLVVPSQRSSPVMLDLDGDGKNDMLTGNTNGQLLFYRNVGTDVAPSFLGYRLIESDGVPIDLSGTPRSRPSVCDWTGDGYLDVLIGAGDGKVHLYQSVGLLGDIDKDYDVDLCDFAVLATAWGTMPGDDNWNPACDISDPADQIIDMLDLEVFAANWLMSVE
jgi:hypothetical protein